MSKDQKKQLGVLSLIVALVVVLLGSLLFVGAVSGWFDNNKVVLSPEFYSENAEMVNITADDYERMIKERKSFIVFVDQGGCDTAVRLRGYIEDYTKEAGMRVNRLYFQDMKETSLHEYVKYYPSVVMVSEGRVVGYLKADSDEDADKYNDYDAFKKWMELFL